MIPEPSAEEDVQRLRMNIDLEGENVVGCSVNGLDYYYPWSGLSSLAKLVFELRGRGFDPRPGQFFLCNTCIQSWLAECIRLSI